MNALLFKFKKIKDSCFEEYYDYFFLKKMLQKISGKEVNTIFLGSSYTRFGIEDNILPEGFYNLSLPSQDIYYASVIIRNLLDKKTKLNNIVLGFGDYYLYSDLSKAKLYSERKRVSNVYIPLFHDAHNYKKDSILNRTITYNIKEIICKIIHYEQELSGNFKNFFAPHKKNVWNGYYFNYTHSRFDRKNALWGDVNLSWQQISQNEKKEAAKNRAIQHNKCKKYVETFNENIKILKELILLCKSNGIKLYICKFPFTNEYKQFLNTEFMPELDLQLENIGVNNTIIDLKTLYKDWNYSCFNDMDHLNDKGALIATKIILKTLGVDT